MDLGKFKNSKNHNCIDLLLKGKLGGGGEHALKITMYSYSSFELSNVYN